MTTRSPWIVSARFDLAAFTLPCLLALAFGAIATWTGIAGPGGQAPAWAWVLLVLGVDVAHVHGTTVRTYLDPFELRRRPALYAIAPTLGLLGGIAAYAIAPMLFWRLLAYLAVFHFVRQQVGWMRLYGRRAGEHAALDRRLDEATIYIATLYPLVAWHARLGAAPDAIDWFVPGDFIAGVPSVAAAIARALWAGLLLAFAARQVERAARGAPIAWGKILLVATTAATWWAGIVWWKNDLAFTATNVIAHGVPYMAISYRVGAPRAQGLPASPVAPLFMRLHKYVLALVALAYAEEWLWDRAVWNDHPRVFPGPLWQPGGWLVVLVPLLNWRNARAIDLKCENNLRLIAQGIDPYTGQPLQGTGGGATPDQGVVQYDQAQDSRRNISSFRMQDWQPYFSNLTNGAILVDLTSRALHYWSEDERVHARGHVRTERFGNIVWGDEMKLRRADSTGFVDNARYQLGQMAARGSAGKILFEGENKYRLQDASFTTCRPEQDDWFIHTGELELDYTRNVGVARHSTVEFMGVPMAYSPWMDFSLNGARKTGFLPPSIGTTSNSGSEVLLPFYWNIAPNYDLEIAPRFMVKRGVAFNNHLRYLQPSASGEIRAEILPGDRVTDTNRYTGLLDHRQQFSDKLSGTLYLQKASDDQYFKDLANRVSATSLVNLPRIGTLTWAEKDWNITGRVERYQTLQDPLAPVIAPYARAPQILFNGQNIDRLGSEWRMTGEFVDFSHPTLTNGWRSTLNPSVALPLQTEYAYVTPKLGYSFTRYDMAAPQAASGDKATYIRSLPTFSVDSTLFLERDDSWLGSAFVQTLEPRLYYVYIPYRDQGMLPNFDSSEMDFNFAQLFTENQFAGNDRINNANQLTAAITSRVLESATGKERLRLALGQRFYFAEQKVTLTNPARKANSSDLILSLGGQVADSLNVDTSWQYNQTESNTQRANLDIRYHPSAGKALNARRRLATTAPSALLAKMWTSTGRVWPNRHARRTAW